MDIFDTYVQQDTTDPRDLRLMLVVLDGRKKGQGLATYEH